MKKRIITLILAFALGAISTRGDLLTVHAQTPPVGTVIGSPTVTCNNPPFTSNSLCTVVFPAGPICYVSSHGMIQCAPISTPSPLVPDGEICTSAFGPNIVVCKIVMAKGGPECVTTNAGWFQCSPLQALRQ
jgi:hypothetical protein